MNYVEKQSIVGQNPEFSEEISWQKEAIFDQVFIRKTGEGFCVPRNCFPTTSAVVSFSFSINEFSSVNIGGQIH